jgi:hypothetical protein
MYLPLCRGLCYKERGLHCPSRGFENVRFARSTDVEVGHPIAPSIRATPILAWIRNGSIRVAIGFEQEKCGANRGFRKQECQKTGENDASPASLLRWGCVREWVTGGGRANRRR